ncbi:MAG TPA: stage II sporulation protein M, partial [Planctomycetaceae bacterium]|nr:stage II sporulation protein M [Planctomycetaceae bacterium]
MKVGALLERRQERWVELERLCGAVGLPGAKPDAETVNRFARLYRDACA